MLTKSLWKSVAVKSLRMGWPAGLEMAERKLEPSGIRYQLMAGIFEDVFPTDAALEKVLAEIEALDYEALCVRQTHHGMGLTEAFCNLRKEAKQKALMEAGILRDMAKDRGFVLPWRAGNTYWTWLQLNHRVRPTLRTVDDSLWCGVPIDMADGHTKEGLDRDTRITILSGHYSQHRYLGRMVSSNGWGRVRDIVHSKEVIETVVQRRMF